MPESPESPTTPYVPAREGVGISLAGVFVAPSVLLVGAGFVFVFHYDPSIAGDPGFGQVVGNDEGNITIGALRGIAFMGAGIVSAILGRVFQK